MSTDDSPVTTKKQKSPGDRNLVLAGIITLASILGLAVAASYIPSLSEPEQTEYVCSSSIEFGVGGLNPGSEVLVGGIQHGVVTAVKTIVDPISHDPKEIEIYFNLDSSIPVRMDAIVRKYVGVSGTNGTLNFASLGTPAHAFEPGARRDLPLSAPASGIDAFLGQRAGKTALGIQDKASIFERRMGNTIDRSKEHLLDAQMNITNLDGRITGDVKQWKNVVLGILDKSDNWKLKWNDIISMVRTIRSAITPITEFISWAQEDAVKKIQRAMGNFSIARDNVALTRKKINGLDDQFRQITQNAQAAIALGEKSLTQLEILIPEARNSLQRTFATGSLAGGQLARLQSSILTTGLDAIFHSPDDATWRRIQLAESVEDAILATTSLHQASTVLESFVAMHPDALKSNPRLAKLLAEPIDLQVRKLNERLRALYEYFVRHAP